MIPCEKEGGEVFIYNNDIRVQHTALHGIWILVILSTQNQRVQQLFHVVKIHVLSVLSLPNKNSHAVRRT